jgi:hypothetical protein
MKRINYYLTICLAHLYRLLLPFLALLEFGIFGKEFVYIGITFIAYAMIDYCAYSFRFKFWYCAYQNASRSPMTPDNIDWSTVKKSDAVGLSVTTAIIGVAIIIVYFVLKLFIN